MHQFLGVRIYLVRVAYFATKNSADQDRIEPFLVRLCILISLGDRLGEIKSFTVQGASAGASAADFEVRLANRFSSDWVCSVEKIPLVALAVQTVGLRSSNLLHCQARLNIRKQLWELFPGQQIATAAGILLPGLFVLVALDVHHFKVGRNLGICRIVLGTILRVCFPVRFFQEFLPLIYLACHGNELVEISVVVLPVVRERNFPSGISGSCRVQPCLVLAVLALRVMLLLLVSDEVFTGATQHPARRRPHHRSCRLAQHLLDA
mmetsp:Transcript_28787/g.67739  ORF Transcript_28787/g.67739 Transcript_28787/m.67739 type:complete len:264 (-) Transcript_28787:666-1457(-)